MEIWEFEVAVSSQQASVSLCSMCLPFLLCVPCECGMNVFMFCLSPLHAQNAVLIVDCQYFQCTGGYDDQVCNTCEPYYVTYDNCKDPSQFTLTIPYIMPNKTASVRMCVVLGCNDLYVPDFVFAGQLHCFLGVRPLLPQGDCRGGCVQLHLL